VATQTFMCKFRTFPGLYKDLYIFSRTISTVNKDDKRA